MNESAGSKTVRQQIMDAIAGIPRTARDLAREFRMPERQIEDHLAHIAKTVGGARGRSRGDRPARRFRLHPAACDDCDFVFAARTRLTTPSRCPRCRSEHIAPPRYSIDPVER
jgi:predicted Zn-ribbon and HTH transcriptional regulator